ncbi:hypothetical protein, partial [Ferrovum myxofaciens]|uniref:hypothetical protein n=1 Tax=Ferrovum myxofaciens TaxID=416213 RepID=UPI000553515A
QTNSNSFPIIHRPDQKMIQNPKLTLGNFILLFYGKFRLLVTLMVMFIACVAVWGVWAALLGFILSGLIENSYDAMVFGAALAIPAALLTFAWFNRGKHAGGTKYSDKTARH